MTTIAIKNNEVAADTRICGEYILPVQKEKIRKIKTPPLSKRKGEYIIIGGAGSVCDIQAFEEWLENSCDPNEYPQTEEASYFVLDKEGIWSYESNHLPVYCGSMGAFGSGRTYAMGAMYNGASAREAVKISILLDPYTGGTITKLKL